MKKHHYDQSYRNMTFRLARQRLANLADGVEEIKHGPADSDVQAAVFGFIRTITSNFHKFLDFNFSDRQSAVTIRTNPRWNEHNRSARIDLGTDDVKFWCGDLDLSFSVVYADPKMFDSIEQFISRVYNG